MKLGAGPVRQSLPRSALDVSKLTPFVDALPIPPIITPSPDASMNGVPSYRVKMQEIESRIHRDVKPTRFWSFGSTFPGPTFEARRGRKVSITWINDFPTK